MLKDSSERSPFGDPKNQMKIERHSSRRKTQMEEAAGNPLAVRTEQRRSGQSEIRLERNIERKIDRERISSGEITRL